MAAQTAALVLVRTHQGRREVLLVHPGGPFWASKQKGAWSFPKGLLEPGEAPLMAAKREFQEETGAPPPDGPYRALGEVKLKSGKRVISFTTEGDFDVATLRSNEVSIEWPPRSGKTRLVPEVDQARWVGLEEALELINPALVPQVFAALEPNREQPE